MISRDLKEASLFIPPFFALLAICVGALPFVERVFGLLPSILRYPQAAATLATIAAFALIGHDFLLRRPVGVMEIKKAHQRLRTGALLVLSGAVLLAVYIGYADYLTESRDRPTAANQAGLMLLYIASYVALARGFWRMVFRAYATHKKQLKLADVAAKRGSSR